MWNRPNIFETLVHFVLEQQVSLASALAALNKLKEKTGDLTPENLLKLNDEEMRACYHYLSAPINGKRPKALK